MTPSRLLVVFATSALLAARPASARPITHGFTGPLDQAAADGSDQFSGSFTINSPAHTSLNTPYGNPHSEWDDVTAALNISGKHV